MLSSLKLTAFCPDCGSILPKQKAVGEVQCFECTQKVQGGEAEDKGNESKIQYLVTFNTRETYEKRRAIKLEEEDEGPTVEKKCPKCDNETMSYATLQLRSADEGQTVFFTCTKCKFKYNENS